MRQTTQQEKQRNSVLFYPDENKITKHKRRQCPPVKRCVHTWDEHVSRVQDVDWRVATLYTPVTPCWENACPGKKTHKTERHACDVLPRVFLTCLWFLHRKHLNHCLQRNIHTSISKSLEQRQWGEGVENNSINEGVGGWGSWDLHGSASSSETDQSWH